MISVKLKSPGTLRAGIGTLAKLRQTTIAAEIKRNGGIIAEYAAKMTPPFLQKGGISKGAVSQSWNTQKRTGEKAVKGDIARLFQPLRSLGLLKNVQWAAAAAKMIRRRDIEALEKFLAAKGVHAHVVEAATEAMHASARNSRGRIKKTQRALLVISAPSISALTKLKVSHVGVAKAGWTPAIVAGGRSMPPDWISRHSTPGAVRDRTSNPLRPSWRAENNVRFGSSFNELQIAQKAVEIRDKTAGKEIKALLHARLKQGMRSTGLGK